MAKTSGWRHSTHYRSTDAEDEKVADNRKKMEKKCMKTLLADLAPLLGNCFKASLVARQWGGTAIDITLDGLEHSDVSVYFRYGDAGSSYGNCEGISISGSGVFKVVNSMGRAYGFDFDTLRMKPATLKKMAKAITGHLQIILDRKTDKNNHTIKATGHAEKVVALLKENGFEAKVGGYEDSIRLIVKDICVLSVSSTGLLASQGRYESIPVRATHENIVEVVKAIKYLREVVAGHRHDH